jgi:hypothetical protein
MLNFHEITSACVENFSYRQNKNVTKLLPIKLAYSMKSPDEQQETQKKKLLM